MKWNEFYKAIDGGRFAPVYLFTGSEEYVKREALDALRRKLLPAGLEALNDVTLEGVGAQQITDTSETMPVMCERRMVTVMDWAPLLPAKSKNEEAEVEWMHRWLENPPDSCVLVFCMRQEPDGRKKMTALLKKQAEVVTFDYLTEAELSKWCASKLKPFGKKLTRAGLSALTYMAGQELTRLNGELDKLIAYLGDERDEIGEADVAAVVSPSLEFNVFELINHLLSGDMKKAQQTVNSMLQGGQSTVGILAMLTRQIRQLTHMKCALDAGQTAQSVQSLLKLHPYAAKQTARQCARLSADWLTAMYARCVDSDYAGKSGRLRDRDALDALILQIGLAEGRER